MNVRLDITKVEHVMIRINDINHRLTIQEARTLYMMIGVIIGKKHSTQIIETTKQLVAAHFDLINPHILKSKNRSEDIAYPRQLAYAIISDFNLSSGEIGRAFNRDHGTVLYGVKKIRTSPDKKVQQDYALLRKEVNDLLKGHNE